MSRGRDGVRRGRSNARLGTGAAPVPWSKASAAAMRGFSTDHSVHGRARESTPASASASSASES